VITLPLFEGPKNIAVFLLLSFFFFNSFKDQFTHYKKTVLDGLLLLIFLVALLSSVFSPFDAKWFDLTDPLRYLLVAWVVAHLKFSKQQTIIISVLLVLSTFLGALEGYYQNITGTNYYFKLYSVGHTNHSFIYLAIVTLTVFTALVLSVLKRSLYLSLPLLSIFTFFVYLLYTGGSRASAVAFFISLFSLTLVFFVFLSRRRKIVLFFLSMLPIFFLVAFSQAPENMSRIIKNPSAVNAISSKRIELANTALVAFKERPLLGVGIGNFRKIDKDIVKKWSGKKEIKLSDYYFSSHAHSVYFTTLAEKGIIGLIVLLALFLYWAYWLYRYFPKKMDIKDPVEFMLWASAFSATLVIMISGLANTSFHHENALLVLILFSLMLGSSSLGKKE